MTLPNKLTLIRILLVPIMIVAMYTDMFNITFEFNHSVKTMNYVALLIFVVASLTDFFDGYLARKNNQITTFGKFADPLADKLLVISSMIVFLDLNLISAWILLVIVSREFIVSGVRLVAVNSGKVIAASKLGKFKTILTMIALIVIYIGLIDIGNYILILATLFTIISGLEYLWKNKDIILESV